MGMSEERFAELTGIPASYWLHPSHELSTHQLARIAEILTRPVDWFLSEDVKLF
jgi:transcriptional regulator with XRE-family HTH domain